MSESFVHLHTHSYYSLLASPCSPKAILDKVGRLNQPAVALTDRGYGYGLLEFYLEAQQESSIKPILGAELNLVPHSRWDKKVATDHPSGLVVLLAQDNIGYQNLIKILSISATEGFSQEPQVDWETLEKYSGGVILLTGDAQSSLAKTAEQLGKQSGKRWLEKAQAIFPRKIYLEAVANRDPHQQRWNQQLLEWSEEYPLVITTNSLGAETIDLTSAQVLQSIATGMQVESEIPPEMNDRLLLSWKEVAARVPYFSAEKLESARQNTVDIAESIAVDIPLGESHLPQFLATSKADEAKILAEKCWENLPKKYQTDQQAVAKARLEFELDVIGRMGFSAYFLIVADLIAFAKQNGIAVGPGRGSAAGSIVSFLLNITTIDPIRYELLFERFLNPERISMPDIDIDFSDERRDEVVQYVQQKYGAEKVARVCTFGTLAAKAALKDVGRAYGVDFSLMNRLTKVLPNRPGFKLLEAEKIKDFIDLLENNPLLTEVFDIAKRLEGGIRHVSVHACAVIIADKALDTYAPLQLSPSDELSVITQFPYQQLESLGLLKMDFLGLKNLSILEKTIAYIDTIHSEKIDMSTIPLDDQATFLMMSRGETTGVFQFESAGMRRYLRELQPTEFEDLVAMNALYRPGPMEYIPEYIKGKHHPEKVSYSDPVLKEILHKTYGIAVYQEQVLKIAQELAGFSLGEADILRKAIGKKVAHMLKEQREKFIKGAVDRGHKKALIEKIFDEIIVPFSGYGFNRSHSVCYARIAYETAYLKANYPVEFMAAMMTTDRNNTDRLVIEMNDCQQMNIEILPPSINQSDVYFTVTSSPRHEAALWPADQPRGQIRFGLSAIKGVGEETVRIIIEERNLRGKFKSFHDVAQRLPAKIFSKKTLEALAHSGAFDDFGERGLIIPRLADMARLAKEYSQRAETGQTSLFGEETDQSDDFIQLGDNTPALSAQEILQHERNSLGLFVSDHPLRTFQPYFKKQGQLISQLTQMENNKDQKYLVHGLVVQCRRIVTRKGKVMATGQIEDSTGKIEVMVFPGVYEKTKAEAFQSDIVWRVRGSLEDNNGTLILIANELQMTSLSQLDRWKSNRCLIEVPAQATQEQTQTLKKLLVEYRQEKGSTVVVKINETEKVIPFAVDYSDELQQKIQALWQR